MCRFPLSTWVIIGPVGRLRWEVLDAERRRADLRTRLVIAAGVATAVLVIAAVAYIATKGESRPAAPDTRALVVVEDLASRGLTIDATPPTAAVSGYPRGDVLSAAFATIDGAHVEVLLFETPAAASELVAAMSGSLVFHCGDVVMSLNPGRGVEPSAALLSSAANARELLGTRGTCSPLQL
jgi:hypothetical protein